MARILVVEDDELIRVSLQDILTLHGYAVSIAGDAGEARAALAEKTMDLILLDVWLPGENGITLCREIRRRRGVVLAAVLLVALVLMVCGGGLAAASWNRLLCIAGAAALSHAAEDSDTLYYQASLNEEHQTFYRQAGYAEVREDTFSVGDTITLRCLDENGEESGPKHVRKCSASWEPMCWREVSWC
ncbi:MAG: response regulator [Lachnospiraceae bacterium]|nr:response regulator [Lachnospiraceae bacterium]